jgi:signal peptidase II
VHDLQAARGASLSDAEATAPAAGRPLVALVVVIAAAVLVADVLTKMIAVEELSGRAPVEVLDGWLELRLVRNSGAAFGLAQGLTILFTLVAVAVVVVILRLASRMRSRGWAVALGLILGGAVGNLLDRIFREPGPLRGRVIDFLELPHWPVFNLADSAIVCGGVIMVALTATGRSYDGHRASG